MFWNIFLEKVEGLLYYIKQKNMQFLQLIELFQNKLLIIQPN